MAETATTTETVETEKVFSLTEGKYIDKPVDKEPTPSHELAPDMDDPAPAVKVEEKKADPAPTAEPTAEEKKVAEDKAKADADAKAKEDAAKTEVKFEPGAYIKEKWGEKFGLETESDVQEILDATEELTSKYSELEKENKELKSKSTFRSEQEEKIAKFLAPYPPDKFGEGLQTSAAIMAMDPASVSERVAMEEAYILKKPHLTRDEAKEKFAEIYDTKFKINKEDFDTDEAYNKKKRSVELDLKDAVAEARQTLTQEQAKLKVAKVDKKEDPKPEAPKEVPAEVLNIYNKEIENFLNPSNGKPFDRYEFKSEDGKEVLFSMVFDKDKLKDIKEFMGWYIKNPQNYSKDGKIPNFTAQELAKSASRMLHGDWMENQLWSAVKTVAGKMKAEQIASTSPEKKSTGTGDIKLNIDEQFEELAKKEKEAREKQKR